MAPHVHEHRLRPPLWRFPGGLDHAVLPVGGYHLLERHSATASEGGVRPQLHPRYADPVHLLHRLFPGVAAGRAARQRHWLSAGHRARASGRRPRLSAVLAGGQPDGLPAVPGGVVHPGGRDHPVAGVGQPLCGDHRSEANRLGPPQRHPGLQLTRHDDRALCRGHPDPGNAGNVCAAALSGTGRRPPGDRRRLRQAATSPDRDGGRRGGRARRRRPSLFATYGWGRRQSFSTLAARWRSAASWSASCRNRRSAA
jgi:hypothetical protein